MRTGTTNVGTSVLLPPTVGRLDRWGPAFANPIGSGRPRNSQQTLALTSANPRERNPKLNGSPWSTSYAVKRTTPSKQKKGMRGRKG